ncbi:SGNH/GDSL hydrolase family protein [Cryobacterium tagatosivorans]|uniref:SGNH/GDSL hydrolase family protein n=1 Tax=Cryobacterium tagatosivorans TaxID=1259199 RepID=A0A4R8UBM4_9MICO|nr:SGNH/GDSL hydrolase family protein [Cryobacterium tagatosivorans]TFB47212.1 SGNH/GDSL hydrolase family protein [Cryobacterium tagatosivorans]
MSNRFERYVAIGDSFTEGVGDDLPGGQVRGWADLVALGLAEASTAPVAYANLAVRGKLLGPIVADQLEPALAQSPDLVSICGGGNDLMRPRVEIPYVVDLLGVVVDRAIAQGAHVVMLSGANPSRHLPMGALIQRRGDLLADACRAAFTRPGVTLVDNWADRELEERRFWSADKLHLNARGHTRIAARVLDALDVPVPGEWGTDAEGQAPADDRVQGTAAYYREFVLPWIGRRLTGRSSGDGRPPKRPILEPVDLG